MASCPSPVRLVGTTTPTWQSASIRRGSGSPTAPATSTCFAAAWSTSRLKAGSAAQASLRLRCRHGQRAAGRSNPSRTRPVVRKMRTAVTSTARNSLSVLVGDAARAFRRLAPMAFAEVSTHALVAYDARQQVTAAARQAYMHRLPGMCPQCLAGLCNSRTDACAGVRLRRWGPTYRCLPIPHRALRRVCMLLGGDAHRGLSHACALRCLGVGSGNGYLGSSLGFRRLPL